jgi:hypothetical protein
MFGFGEFGSSLKMRLNRLSPSSLQLMAGSLPEISAKYVLTVYKPFSRAKRYVLKPMRSDCSKIESTGVELGLRVKRLSWTRKINRDMISFYAILLNILSATKRRGLSCWARQSRVTVVLHSHSSR